MRSYFATLCPCLPVLAGVCLLLAGLTPHGLGTRLDEASTGTDVQAHPACFNPTRRVQLRQAYRCYRRQCLRLSQAWTPRELDASRAAVQEAADAYNQVADDTDPSAFDGTRLPRHLAISK